MDLLPRDAARESLVFGLRMTNGLLLTAEHEKVWDSLTESTLRSHPIFIDIE